VWGACILFLVPPFYRLLNLLPRLAPLALVLGALAAAPSHAQTAAAGAGGDPAASVLLSRARDRQHEGAFTASVTCIRESFLGGADTLRGRWESGRLPGERRLSLSGGDDAFEWWSRADGGEQWRREGTQGRLRRLPPHSRRKPAFAPDVSYEDLARLPLGYLDGHRGAQRLSETDSTVTLGLLPGGALATLYGKLEVTLGRGDGLLRRVFFLGAQGRPSKTLTIARYVATPQGMFPAELVFSSVDGLSATRLSFSPTAEATARDKAQAPRAEAGASPPRFAEPRWEPRDRTPGGE
jgi:hypothetical protein